MFPQNIFDALCAIDPTWLVFALVFILLDILTGIAKGASQHDISSEKMKRGFWHKLGIIAALIVAGLLDAAAGAGLDLGFEVPVFEGACGYVVIMELISILENIAVINPELAGSRLFQLLRGSEADEMLPSGTTTGGE